MKDILVFGTGKYFEWKKAAIMKKYNIVAFLDNKVKQHTTQNYENTNINIINPEDIDLQEDIEIFFMSVHFVSMWRQLSEKVVNAKRFVFPYLEQPLFENEESLKDYLECIEFEQDYFTCITKTKEKFIITNEEEWRSFLRKAYYNRYSLIREIAAMDIKPISLQFGTERGTPVDRYYIEKFLSDNKTLIKGDVLEVESAFYTKKYGEDRVKNAIVMDVDAVGAEITFQANLENGSGIRDEVADCFILTQTLMYIFDLKSAAHNICRLLKKGGHVLITCSGLSQNSRRCMDNYGCYFNFNKAVFDRMFESELSMHVLETGSYGNVKTVSAHLNGLCQEDIKKKDFEINDVYYPLIVYAVVKKE